MWFFYIRYLLYKSFHLRRQSRPGRLCRILLPERSLG
jgi:hypothetical protein